MKDVHNTKGRTLPALVGSEVDPSIETPTEEFCLGRVISEFYVPLHCTAPARGAPGGLSIDCTL